MSRERNEQLEKLREQDITLYSISRIDTINNCLYEAYRTYCLEDRGQNSIYGIMGTKIHDTLEKITNGEAIEKDLLPSMTAELEDMEMLGIEFPKDRNGGDSIKDGWVSDMTHFCETYKSPKGNFSTEELFIYKTPNNNYFHGYIDLIRNNKDGSVSIYDYKTSSLYKGEDIKKHGRQLVVYAMGLEQAGYTVKSVSWIMLKYVEVEFMGKKSVRSKEKTLLNKVIERRKIGSELSKYVERDLEELGYDEIDIEVMLHEFKETNKFDCLPESIKEGYKVKPYVMNYELTEDVREECVNYIDSTIEMWEKLGKDSKNYPPRSFMKETKTGKLTDDTFFCVALCNHRKSCEFIKDYLETKEDDKDDYSDLF